MRPLRTNLILLAGAVALVLLLGTKLYRGNPVVLNPLVPPLTRIQALGDCTLGTGTETSVAGWDPRALPILERAVSGGADTGQRRAMERLREGSARMGRLAGEMEQARLSMQQDALDIAEALGDRRVGLIIENKELLSRLYAEGMVWDEALERIAP